jgi:hypothetical protein
VSRVVATAELCSFLNAVAVRLKSLSLFLPKLWLAVFMEGTCRTWDWNKDLTCWEFWWLFFPHVKGNQDWHMIVPKSSAPSSYTYFSINGLHLQYPLSAANSTFPLRFGNSEPSPILNKYFRVTSGLKQKKNVLLSLYAGGSECGQECQKQRILKHLQLCQLHCL